MLRLLLCTLLLASSLAAQQAPYAKPGGAKATATGPQPPSCQWLTQGSAERYLGGDVFLKLSSPDVEKRFCHFVQPQSRQSLDILVSKKPLTTCPAGSMLLRGVGNQAAMCKARSAKGDMVSGRVRDSFFTITYHS